VAWQEVFERNPLGFDRATPGRAISDLTAAGRTITRSPRTLLTWLGQLGGGFWLAFGALTLLAAGGLAVERIRPRWWRRLWVRAPRQSRRSLLGVATLQILERAVIPAGLLLVWSVGGLLAEAGAPAFEAVRSLLALWLAYRFVDATVEAFLKRSGREGSRSLYPGLHGLLNFSLGWLTGWLILNAVQYRDDVQSLWITGGYLVAVLWLFGIVRHRTHVLSLLPESGNWAYLRFRQAVSLAYLPLVYASLVISLLSVGGYRNLAAVVLGRGWAVIGVCLLALLLYRTGCQLLRRSICPGTEEDGRADEDVDPQGPARLEALQASQRLLGLIAFLVSLSLSLRVLGLREPFLYLLQLTWLQVGSVRITGMAIWTAVVILVLVNLVSRWLQAMLALRVYAGLGIAAGEAYALNRLLHYALLAVGTLLVLNSLGLSPESLAIVIGGLSVGIGFGLQDIANNIASGLILLTSRQVRQGDVISVGDRTGMVREVNLRSTVVTTGENVSLLIPNSKLLGDTLINWTHGSSTVRASVPFGVSYNQQPEEVIEAALQVARENAEVLPEPPPEVWFKAMGDSSLDFELLVWVDMKVSLRQRVTSQIYVALLRAFREREIEIPYPQRDLHLRGGVPWEELVEALKGNGKAPQNERNGGMHAPAESQSAPSTRSAS